MRKLLLVLSFILVVTMSACTNDIGLDDPVDDDPGLVDEDDDPNDIDDPNDGGDPEPDDTIIPLDPDAEYVLDDTPNPLNETIQTREEVLVIVNEILDAMEILNPVPSSDPLFTEELPIVRSELDFINNERIFDDHFSFGALSAQGYLRVIRDELNPFDPFAEDQWVIREALMIDNSVYTKKTFRIYVNEDEVQYQYYYIDGYDRVVAADAWISIKDGVLELSFSSIAYYYEEGHFEHGIRSYYKQDDIEYTWQVFQHEGAFVGLNYIERNFAEDSYLHRKIDNSIEGVDRDQVRYYNPETDLYYNMLYKNDVESFLYLIQYNEQNQYIFTVDREGDGDFEFDFNLMLMDGWDTIDKEDYTYVLYDNDTAISLPDRMWVKVYEGFGLFLNGLTDQTELDGFFELDGSGLTSPITYAQLLELEDQIRQEAAVSIDDFHNTEYANIQDHFDVIFDVFDINVFYSMSQAFVE